MADKKKVEEGGIVTTYDRIPGRPQSMRSRVRIASGQCAFPFQLSGRLSPLQWVVPEGSFREEKGGEA